MKVLVLGGAGYIGSACVQDLVKADHEVTVIDNLSKGKRELVNSKAEFVELDLLDRDNFHEFLSENSGFEAVIHFAAHKDAGASMQDAITYSENLRIMINVLDGLVKSNISKIIFSSSAAVYGNPEADLITEEHPLNPINYYGYTKLACEHLMQWYERVHGLKYVALRYFNVAGDHGLNYFDPNARNLFPIIQDVITGKRPELEVYGNDYDTRDGTCIRDYIHLTDLVEAHVLALNCPNSEILNLGTKNGCTVLEVCEEFENQLGRKISKKIVERRLGDPPSLIADSKKAKQVLNWEAKLSLKDMVASSLTFISSND